MLFSVLELLLEDEMLPSRNCDHPLSGNWEGYRECHLKPDLLLIYGKPNLEIMRLARLGSHSQLFD
jgi:mRNA interferase YafQ